MQTSGHGNDALMVLVPIALTLVLGCILFGGPADALTAMNAIVAGVAYDVMTVVSGIL